MVKYLKKTAMMIDKQRYGCIRDHMVTRNRRRFGKKLAIEIELRNLCNMIKGQFFKKFNPLKK